MKLTLLAPLFVSLLVVGAAHAQSPDAVFDRYVKASNPDSLDRFGYSIAISGTTMVIGAPGEDSAAAGTSGNQTSNAAPDSGAVYVFRLAQSANGGWSWTQTAYLKASNANAGDLFGSSVAIDGDILVVGAPYEASASTNIDNNPGDNSAPGAGAAYVFARTYLLGSEQWTQQAYLKASNAQGAPAAYNGDNFGHAVAVSGVLVAVGAPNEDSGATSINGAQGDNSIENAGAAYLFRRNGASFWYQDAYIKPSLTSASVLFGGGSCFGSALALDGNRLVAGAPGYRLPVAFNLLEGAGAAFLMERSTATGAWSERQAILSPASGADFRFGEAVDIHGDRMAIGEPWRLAGRGAVHVYRASTNPLSNDWVLDATVAPPLSDSDDLFGISVAISDDLLLAGARGEDGGSTGLGGNPATNTASNSGAAYTWRRSPSLGWTDMRYMKASNADAGDAYGATVALDGSLLLVAATGEAGGSTSGPFAPLDNSASGAGAAYLYHRISDCNGNGIDDPSELASQDCNQNGVIDACEVAEGTGDCDGNLVPDACQGDANLDGIPDVCQSGGIAYCFGDGTGVACPCGNSGGAGNGCANSVNAQGARLAASGLPFVSNDSLLLSGTGMTSTSSVLYFQGTAQSAGAVFGDGLRCATGAIIRLGTTVNVYGASQWPVPGSQPISVRGAVPAAGGTTRTYQAWYRDASATFCNATARFNLTNGVLVQWLP